MHPDKLTRKRRLIDGIARTVEEEWKDGFKAERHLASARFGRWYNGEVGIMGKLV